MSDPRQPSDDPFSDETPAPANPADPFAAPAEPAPAAPEAGFRASTGEVFDDDPDLIERMDALEGRVEQVAEAVADITELLRLAPGGPWVWHKLEPSGRRDLAEKLVAWVEWLSTRYLANLSQEYVLKLPPRWFTNPVFVELMTALYVGYTSVYSPRQRVPSMALIEWHERGLWPTLERIKALHLVNKNGELATATYEVVTEPDAVDFICGGPNDEEENGS